MKGNKLFVKSMIITAIIGMTTLMIAMFIGIRWFMDDAPITEKLPEKTPIEVPQVAFNSTILGVIKEVDKDTIKVFDIEKRQSVNAVIQTATTIKDAYDKTMPQEMLQVGDIVQLVYEPKKDQLTSINQYIQAWTKSEMKTVKLDRSNRSISIGQNVYKYNDNTVILDDEGNDISIYQVGDHDVLELKGIDDNIYSIKVLEEQGYIEVKNPPINEGIIEIDINRQIPVGGITTPIPVSKGQHKIVVQIPGYETMTKEIEIESGKTTIIDLSEIGRSYTNLTVDVLNVGINYDVKVNDTTYSAGEVIRLPIGSYKVQIVAEGYHIWVQQVTLTEPDMRLQVNLEPIATSGGNSTNAGDTATDGASSSNEEANTGYKVNISTDPTNAKVYINGEFKGNTPYNTTLQLGEYTVTLEKEGYETYQTSIMIDNSDTQNSYLYMLIPKR